jgi:hypothetical protein
MRRSGAAGMAVLLFSRFQKNGRFIGERPADGLLA